jgi:preprotein translocase subunit SecY
VFASLLNMFKVGDLRNKILFTIMCLALYRLGSYIPAPGVDVNQLSDFKEQANEGGVLGLLQLFSGGALTQMAVFALGIMPYITASIIMQILGVVVPKIEQWQEQGAVGQRKITQWTRYLTMVIAIVQATSFAFLLHNQNAISGRDVSGCSCCRSRPAPRCSCGWASSSRSAASATACRC